MKCNPNEGIMDLMAFFKGICFDCASSVEIQACLDRGVPPVNIIYANPTKVRRDSRNVFYHVIVQGNDSIHG